MIDEILFNEETFNKFKNGTKKKISGEQLGNKEYVFEIKAIGGFSSWNYLERYPVCSGDFIYHNDINANDFEIIPNREKNILTIKIKTKEPFIVLKQIITFLFDETSQSYSAEFGYSGWDLTSNICAVEDDCNLLVEINKYNVSFFEVENL